MVGSSQRDPAPMNGGTKRLWGLAALLKAAGRGRQGGLWAGKVMRNKTSKAHHGTSLAQILSTNSSRCSLFGFLQCQTQLLPLSDPQLRVRKLRVGK